MNESLARACWPDRDPIGQVMHQFGTSPGFGDDWKGWLVVGIVADTRSSIRRSVDLVFYADEAWKPINYDTFVIKFTAPYRDELDAMTRRTVYAFDPDIVVGQIVPLDRLWEYQLGTEKLIEAVLKLLAVAAAGLTTVGLFSVLAYAVDRRMQEFGVRMALGATRIDLVQLVLWRGLVLMVVGLFLGLIGAAALTRFIRTLLYNTSAQDPVVLVTVSGILLVAAALACTLPSYRATKVDVTRLLRSE